MLTDGWRVLATCKGDGDWIAAKSGRCCGSCCNGATNAKASSRVESYGQMDVTLHAARSVMFEFETPVPVADASCG